MNSQRHPDWVGQRHEEQDEDHGNAGPKDDSESTESVGGNVDDFNVNVDGAALRQFPLSNLLEDAIEILEASEASAQDKNSAELEPGCSATVADGERRNETKGMVRLHEVVVAMGNVHTSEVIKNLSPGLKSWVLGVRLCNHLCCIQISSWARVTMNLNSNPDPNSDPNPDPNPVSH